jgi:hypothetical protein
MVQDEIIENLTGPAGCYLVFESAFGGRLMLNYSKDRIPKAAVGFWYVRERPHERVGMLEEKFVWDHAVFFWCGYYVGYHCIISKKKPR